MSKRERLIESIRNNPRDVSFRDIDALLRHYGCTVRQKGRGSSHYKYTHPSVAWILEIPKDRPIKAIYANKAIEMIDEIREVLNRD